MKPWLRQGIWLAVALIVPVLLSLALLPLRGLVGLRDRVEAVGGTMTLDSPVMAGTVLTVQLPVTAENQLSKRTVVNPPPGVACRRRQGDRIVRRGSAGACRLA